MTLEDVGHYPMVEDPDGVQHRDARRAQRGVAVAGARSALLLRHDRFELGLGIAVAHAVGLDDDPVQRPGEPERRGVARRRPVDPAPIHT